MLLLERQRSHIYSISRAFTAPRLDLYLDQAVYSFFFVVFFSIRSRVFCSPDDFYLFIWLQEFWAVYLVKTSANNAAFLFGLTATYCFLFDVH